MYKEYVQNRIIQLLAAKDVSERSVSLDLGNSAGYIHGITSGKTLPSMTEFLYICEYFGITPKEFFDEENTDPALVRAITDNLKALDEKKLQLIAELVKALL